MKQVLLCCVPRALNRQVSVFYSEMLEVGMCNFYINVSCIDVLVMNKQKREKKQDVAGCGAELVFNVFQCVPEFKDKCEIWYLAQLEEKHLDAFDQKCSRKNYAAKYQVIRIYNDMV
ncbi:hypothetical protein AV530_001745 [Patagioenas fasciata monilis]|uniref:Uncharacterized protein n=1 Tax=Patagioenas fasciata monilis TaxID=372326 RepID=A0A1V4KM69_PATFA|nr:hypothetical protein AV530_001745 [Patagioenas fasciata monilis]